MTGESFFSYRSGRWFWINLLTIIAASYFYVRDKTIGGPRGSSVYGYAVGIICLLQLPCLMWYGMRKRDYHARFTTLQGCLSFHIWTGFCVALLVPLHAGFHWHWNVHTAAYFLLLATVVSGFVGAIIYRTLATEIPSHRGSGSLARQLSQVEDLSAEIKVLLNAKSDELLSVIDTLDVPAKPGYWWLVFGTRGLDIRAEQASQLAERVPENERELARRIIGLVDQKIDILRGVGKELRALFLIRSWLIFHVPLSYGVIAAVIIHIFSVLYMR